MSQSKAQAATGDPLLVGKSVTATAATTIELDVNNDAVVGTVYGLGVTDGLLGQFPESASVAGHAQTDYPNAVLGYDEGRNVGVRGISALGVGVSGTGKINGVIGTAGGSPPPALNVLAGIFGVGLETASGVVGLTESTRSVAAVVAVALNPNGQAAAFDGRTEGASPGLDVASKKAAESFLKVGSRN